MLGITAQRRGWPARITTLVCAALVLSGGMEAQTRPTRRVLILNETGTWYPAINTIDQGIRAGLQDAPYRLEFYREYMETVLFPDPETQQEFRNFYLRKYQNRKPDVIIAVGPSPLQFILKTHERAFAGVPVIFCLPYGPLPDTLTLDPGITGVTNVVEPAATLEVALRLKPKTKHVIIIGGTSTLDRQTEAMIQQGLRSHTDRLDISYLINLTMPALLTRLRHVPSDAIILFGGITQDAAGTPFTGSESAAAVTAAASAPVFVLTDSFLGHGEVGGELFTRFEQGKITGNMSLRVLTGEKPQDIPVVNGVTQYMFDWRALKRWGLKESDLPPGSIVLNRQPTVWESYQRYIIGFVCLCLLETLLIFGLLWQRARRKSVEKSLLERLTFESLLSDLMTTFINLPEEQVAPNINQNIGRIAEFLNLDRITIYEFSQDRTELTVNFAWTKQPGQTLLAVMETNQLPWWTDRILHCEVIVTSDVNALPDEASLEKEFLRKKDIRSAASVPLEVGGEVFGAMAFASTTRRMVWSEDCVQRLKMLAEIFSNALGRKHAEARRHESEERFRLVANTAPVLIWMSGTDKLCTYFNQGWLDFTGRELAAELGNGWVEGVHPEDLEGCLETFTESFDHRQQFTMEYRLRRHDGNYRWVLEIGVPRFNADGSFAGYIGSVIDVTDRKEAEQAVATVSGRLIEAQDEERHRIARELHDDISQRFALLSIELQRLADALPKSSVELRNGTKQLLKRTSEISSDIHALSHRLHSSKLDYMGAVAAMAGFCGEIAAQTGLEIDFEHTDVPRSLPQDISLCLFRVLQEGLRNAVKYSGAQHFKVELRGTPGAILLLIRDSGTGFDPEAAMKNGGLGLISMRERVSLVKGTISIASKPMGGTEIKIHIPVTQPRAASATQMSFPAVKGVYGKSEDKDLAS